MKNTSRKRLKRGFKLVFPSTPFTVADLRGKGGKIPYITVYKRIEKALSEGVIELFAETPAAGGANGRPQKLYVTT